MTIATRPSFSGARSSKSNLTFGPDSENTIQERETFPFDLSKVKAIYVSSIGTRGTGTIKIEKGMVSPGNSLLVADGFDVSALGADNVCEALSLTTTNTDLQGDSIDVITISMTNCTVPHLIKIEFRKQ